VLVVDAAEHLLKFRLCLAEGDDRPANVNPRGIPMDTATRIELMPLPYAYDALAPHISDRTLHEHHDKHHQTYVDKVNKAIEGTALADAQLERIVKSAEASGDKKLFNAAAQAWNHGFYWHSLSPDGGAPVGHLAEAIDRDFGSLDALKKKLTQEAVDHFASGWAWLVAEDGKLAVIGTHDAATPITGSANPLLTIDVWEHAYYLDVQSKRPVYVDAVVENLLNWDFAAKNFARGTAWTYPA
jgi:Fe-Mn family superoxide dismutase